MNQPKLVLYKFDACPFCQSVMETIQKLNLAVEMKDILHDRTALEKLVADTGRRTVPCLYIDGKPMHESYDIMRWLEENVDKLQKNS